MFDLGKKAVLRVSVKENDVRRRDELRAPAKAVRLGAEISLS